MEDDAVLLKDVADILIVVEVMIDDDGFDVQLDDSICPAGEVLLLNDVF